ncbi:hypothetical protein ACVBEH_14410 [Roseateles sp. GG27B]
MKAKLVAADEWMQQNPPSSTVARAEAREMVQYTQPLGLTVYSMDPIRVMFTISAQTISTTGC